MRRLVLAASLIAAVALPGSAAAGCWATVRLSSTPHGLAAGETWNVGITVLQHGHRPLAGAKPAITIRKDGASTLFRARPAARRGLYRARVVFPETGTWRYEVNDGFVPHCARTHGYPPVTIAAEDDGLLGAAWPVAGGGLLLLASGVGLALRRRLRPAPALR